MDKETKKAQELLEKHIEWYQRAYRDPGIGKKPLEGCDRNKFTRWTCCPQHRTIKRQYDRMKKQAEKFNVDAGQAFIFSVKWWHAFAKKYGIELPNELPYVI